MAILPMPDGAILAPCMPLDFNLPLASQSDWDKLYALLAQQKTLNTGDYLVVGMLPVGAVDRKATTAIGVGDVDAAVGMVDDADTLRHEIGHALGRDHVPGSGPVGPYDENWPTSRRWPRGASWNTALALKARLSVNREARVTRT